MTKTELESKHLAELHALAAEADVPRYRLLPRAELIEKLLDGKPVKRDRPRGERSARGERSGQRERTEKRDRPERDRSQRERPPRRRRERAPRSEAEELAAEGSATEEATPESPPEPAPVAASASTGESESSRPKRRRRRRRFGRKSKGVRAQDLLLPPPGRQALLYGESRAACTSLLREIAAELAGASDGPDPIALLVDPSPEELADWKREAPEAELVVAAQARHASDALAQARRRAEDGEDIILLVDSLTRLEDADTAKEIFDGGLGLQAKGSLTLVAALERTS